MLPNFVVTDPHAAFLQPWRLPPTVTDRARHSEHG
jgi:hypothetical protein